MSCTLTAATTGAAVATMTAVMAASMATPMTAMATVVTILGDRLGLQWLQFKLWNLALTAARPHTRPLGKAFLWWFFTAFTAWVINTSSKRDRKCHCVAMTTSTTSSATVMTALRTSKATATVAASTAGSSGC